MPTNSNNLISELSSATPGTECPSRCPRCGWTGDAATTAVNVSMNMPYDGRYCLSCFAQWIANTFPKLESL